MYKLEFVTTKNTAEYESFLLGLKPAKDLGIQQIAAFGNFKLVVQQVKRNYQVKQGFLKVYRNELWDMLENYFVAFNITHIPRDHNHTTDSLASASTHFKIPKTTQLRYPHRGEVQTMCT